MALITLKCNLKFAFRLSSQICKILSKCNKLVSTAQTILVTLWPPIEINDMKTEVFCRCRSKNLVCHVLKLLPALTLKFCSSSFYLSKHLHNAQGHMEKPTETDLSQRTIKTRPDTRLLKSRAGGQGPYLRSPDHLGRSSEVKEIQS